MAEPVSMKLDMYIMAPKPISTVYFINPSHQSVCLYVYRLLLLGTSVKWYCSNEYTSNKRKIVGSVFLYVVRAISEESRWLIFSQKFLFLMPFEPSFRISESRMIVERAQEKCISWIKWINHICTKLLIEHK
jgi:hypothetical protein